MAQRVTMAQRKATKMILFDLEDCLFDHSFSLRCADSALKRYISRHTGSHSHVLVDSCKRLFQKEMNITIDEDAALRRSRISQTEQLFINRGLPKPSLHDIEALYASYRDAYKNSRRAAPGAIQTMARLREDGYKIASMSSHETAEHQEVIDILGFGHLVDDTIRLDTAMRSAEDGEFLDYAVGQTRHPLHHAVVVRHSSFACKTGQKAQNSGMMKVMINSSPTRNSDRRRPGENAGLIHRLDQLLDRLQIKTRRFTPTISCNRGQVVLEGLGMDLVTEPRTGFHISKKTARSLVETMGTALLLISQRLQVQALFKLGEMIRLLAGGSEIRIFVHGHDQSKMLMNESPPGLMVVEKRHSIVVELSRLTLDTDAHTEPMIRATANHLQLQCDDLMREHPRQAIRRLRSAMVTIAEAAGIREDLLISGEKIEPWIGSKVRVGVGAGAGAGAGADW